MLARYIDHTILKPTTSHIEISKICGEAVEYGFAAVCVPPPYVPGAGRELGGRGGVRVATVIGFPFGYSVAAAKLAEMEQALADGADELDVVINLIALKAGNWAPLEAEMRLLTARIHGAGKIVKVIIESGVLTDEEIIQCCKVYSRIGVDFLKTSTGYAEKGATVEAVRLMRAHLPPEVRIKASGGIRTAALAQQLIDAGADRLGCSASVEIVKAEAAAIGGYQI
jgi:deoxyribose-phosphate aldolase